MGRVQTLPSFFVALHDVFSGKQLLAPVALVFLVLLKFAHVSLVVVCLVYSSTVSTLRVRREQTSSFLVVIYSCFAVELFLAPVALVFSEVVFLLVFLFSLVGCELHVAKVALRNRSNAGVFVGYYTHFCKKIYNYYFYGFNLGHRSKCLCSHTPYCLANRLPHKSHE